MNLTTAFWEVFHKFFKWRPLVLGCCDCHRACYLTMNRVHDMFLDSDGLKNPVIFCPFCGLRHAVMFARLDDNVSGVEIITHFRDELEE